MSQNKYVNNYFQDQKGVIRKTAQFLGKELTDAEVDMLEEHLSFKNMQSNPALNLEGLLKVNDAKTLFLLKFKKKKNNLLQVFLLFFMKTKKKLTAKKRT